MIDNITIDTGNGIATFFLGGNIIFTSRFNGKRYETIKLIKIVDNYDCLIETDCGNLRYYTNNRIISYEQLNVKEL